MRTVVYHIITDVVFNTQINYKSLITNKKYKYIL